VYENRVLRKLFWPKMNEVTGDGGHCTLKNVMICNYHHITFRISNNKE